MGELAESVDVLIVGAGPGGYSAALRAAEHGLEVLLVDEQPAAGGVCLHDGCIPSKELLHLVEVRNLAAEVADRGMRFGDPEIDPEEAREHMASVKETLSSGLASRFETMGVKRAQGRLRFIARDEARLSGEEGTRTLRFEKAVIATGSEPLSRPAGGFSQRIWSSADALALEDVPGELLVIGGGYVGAELASVYAALGSSVRLLEQADQLLPGTDPELVRPLEEKLRRALAEVRTGASVEGVEEDDEGVRVRVDDEELVADRVLIATGRRPSTRDLGLEELGVELDEDGRIPVDEQCRTEVADVFALGDVAGGVPLAHVAMYEGRVVADVLAGHREARRDARAVPRVVYTDPQVAWCGRSTASGDEDVEVVTFPWRYSGRALTMGGTEGLTKLAYARDDHRVLGAGIVGRQAEALISEVVLAIEMGAVLEDLSLSIHPHPTLGETLPDAAGRAGEPEESAGGDAPREAAAAAGA